MLVVLYNINAVNQSENEVLFLCFITLIQIMQLPLFIHSQTPSNKLFSFSLVEPGGGVDFECLHAKPLMTHNFKYFIAFRGDSRGFLTLTALKITSSFFSPLKLGIDLGLGNR